MKYFFLGLSYTLLSIFQGYGQCSSCDITVSSSSSSNYNINNQKLCITGGTYSGKVTLGANGELCIGPSANFTGKLTVNGPNSEIINFGTMNFGSLNLNNSSNFTSTNSVVMSNLNLNSGSTGEFLNSFQASNLTLNSGSRLDVSGSIDFNNVEINSGSRLMALSGTLNTSNIAVNAMLVLLLLLPSMVI